MDSTFVETPESPDEVLLLRDLAIAKRRVALLKRKQALESEWGIIAYRPHTKQELFHANGMFKFRYARTGNRFGKSEMGAAEDVAFALGYRPWYPQGHPLRTLGIPAHPTKGLIVVADWEKSTEVFTEREGAGRGKLFKYIPKSCLGSVTRNHSGAIDKISVKHISGGWSVIHLDTVKSYKQNPLGQESSVWDWVHIDEPCPEKMFTAIARGLVDRGGKAWFTCTPLMEPWINNMFAPDLGTDNSDTAELVRGKFWMMTGSIYDNPYNSKEDIEDFLALLSPDERECRASGIPTAFAGLVYKEFQWHIHRRVEPPPGWRSWSEPPLDYCIRYAIDYHPRKPDAVLFLATSPDDYTYVFHDIWKTMLTKDEAEEIKSVLGPRVALPGLVDPLASTPNKVTDVTVLDELRRCGLAVLPATKDPENGIRAVKAQLKSRDKFGNPTLIFNAECTRTIYEISRGFVWGGDTNKPLKQDDDMMENLYRLCLQGLSYIEPTSDIDYINLRHDVTFPENVVDLDFAAGLTDTPTFRANRYRR